MDECIESLEEAKLFSTFDANLGYLQVELYKKDIDETAIVAHIRFYKYTKILFDLKSAPEMFQRATDVVHTTVKWHYAPVYIDNIIKFKDTPKNRLRHIEKVLKLLNSVRMIVKLKKCSRISETIDYLSHVISPIKRHDATKNTEVINAL